MRWFPFLVVVVSCAIASEPRDAAAGERFAFLDVRSARTLLQAERAAPRQCRVRQGRRWRTQNCSTVVAVVGVPGTGAMETVRFRWGGDVIVTDPYILTRIGAPKGVNTHYRVCTKRHPQCAYAVLAWKIPIRDRRTGRWRDVVYTPYSDALRRPEVIAEGRRYFRTIIREAREELRHRGVRSLLDGGHLAVDVVPRATTAAIAIVEKVDHREFERCAGNSACVRDLVDVTRVVLAVNGSHAYRHAVSRAGARGFMQFTPRTWEMVRQQYPAARLPAFADGSADHRTSVTASVLLNDYNLTLLTDGRARALLQSPEALTRYSAAAYNGNPRWAIRAIAQCGAQWMTQACGLRPETVVYLAKVRAIWPIVMGQPG